MRLLDPRFNYVPAAATDVAATWRRFGFNPRANEQRRAQLRRHVSAVTAELPSETPAIRVLGKLQA